MEEKQKAVPDVEMINIFACRKEALVRDTQSLVDSLGKGLARQILPVKPVDELP
jgi:hypothetical protein